MVAISSAERPVDRPTGGSADRPADGPAEGPVLVLGGKGLVGRAVAAAAGDRPVHAPGREEADVTDPGGMATILEELEPRAVINCAVFQPVDLCEDRPQEAFRVNAVAAGQVAEACAARAVPLFHLSTDYVFDGSRREPWPEDACPGPLSVYAASKLAGEHLVLAASPRHRVVRTAAVFGTPAPGHGNLPFVERMLERARAGEPTRVVDDQVVSPTWNRHLARALWELLEVESGGVVHVVNRGETSWYGLARILFEAVGRPDLLSPTTAAEFDAPARRPAYSALETGRLRRLGLEELSPWREALGAYLREAHPGLT